MPGKQRDPGRGAAWASGLVVVDKPGGLTSHDVVARIRRLAGTRRVGHAGTLDPMATGVLVIGIEKATRLLGHLMLTEKTYEATIRLGQSTTTDDADGEALPAGGSVPPLRSPGGTASPYSPGAPGCGPDEGAGSVPGARVTRAVDVSRAALDEQVAKLTGDILQVPSSVSAIKVNGQRAYKLTRAGEAPELAARPVTVHEFTVLDVTRDGDFLDVAARVRCSSGTYIRALARDLGAALGTGGHLTALRRTAVGPYDITQARTLEELEANHQDDPERRRLTPPARTVIPLAEAAAAAFPRLDLTADEARRLAQGARLPLPAGVAAAPVAAFDPDGALVGLVTGEGGVLRSLAVFVDAAAGNP